MAASGAVPHDRDLVARGHLGHERARAVRGARPVRRGCRPAHRSAVRRAHRRRRRAGCRPPSCPPACRGRSPTSCARRRSRSATLGEVPDDRRAPPARPARAPRVPRHPARPPVHGARSSGTSVRVGGRVFGHLYLSEKPGGFTAEDEDVVVSLAAAAGAAVANAQLYADAQRREHWLRAGPGHHDDAAGGRRRRRTRSNASSRPPGRPTRRTPPRSRCPAWAASCSSRSRSVAGAASCWAPPMPPGSRAWTGDRRRAPG